MENKVPTQMGGGSESGSRIGTGVGERCMEYAVVALMGLHSQSFYRV